MIRSLRVVNTRAVHGTEITTTKQPHNTAGSENITQTASHCAAMNEMVMVVVMVGMVVVVVMVVVCKVIFVSNPT